MVSDREESTRQIVKLVFTESVFLTLGLSPFGTFVLTDVRSCGSDCHG